MNVYVYIYVCVWELGMVYACGILTHAFFAGGSNEAAPALPHSSLMPARSEM